MEKEIKCIRSFYQNDKVASKYIDERFSKPLGLVQHQIQVETIRNVISTYDINNVLEVACGPARLTSEITGFTKGVAIDSSRQMLEIARRRVHHNSHWHFIQGNAFGPGLKQCFQLIYSFRFIRHFKFSDRIKIYKTFNELLEDRGIIIFDAVHYEKVAIIRNLENRGQKEIIYDKIYQNIKELEDELYNEGYEIIELQGLLHHFYFQAAISRIANKLKLDKIGIKLIKSFERYPLGNPLEWIVVCQKK